MDQFKNQKNPKTNGKGKEAPHLRTKYQNIDSTQQFLDWVNQLELEKTSVGRVLFDLEERFSLRRTAVLFLFALILAVTLHFEVDFSHSYNLGDTVSADIKSPLSFEIVDEVTTAQKRQEAEDNVSTVFDFDPDVFDKLYGNIGTSFRKMRPIVREVLGSQKGSKREERIKDLYHYKSEFDRLLGVSLPDRIFEWLVDSEFNATLENLTLSALEKWYERRIGNDINKIAPQEKLFTIQEITGNRKSREYQVARSEVVDILQPNYFNFDGLLGYERLNKKDKQNIEKLALLLLKPNITPNMQETNLRKQKAKEAVLPTVISVKKNQIIATAGTVIQPSHSILLREIENLKATRRYGFISVMTALLFMVLMLVFFAFFRRFTVTRIRMEVRDIIAMGVVSFLVVVFTKIFLFLTEGALVEQLGHFIPSTVFLYLAPVAAGPMLIGLLMAYGEVVWIYAVFQSLILGVMLDLNFHFMVYSLIGGVAAARGVYGCKKRNDIYISGIKTGLVNALILLFLMSIDSLMRDTFSLDVLYFGAAGFIAGMLSSMVAMSIIPVLEAAFNYTTDVRLLELSNLNHPLLKKMLVQAPGTYHHSMMVGSMVEAAAEQIGANPLLAKVMAYYHDIGKMEHPQYFIENQRRGHNPHDQISPFMSKTVLVAHVKDGAELGLKHKLGQAIIDGIVQHHGTTLISFFYNKALEKCEDSKMDQVSEETFRYPGPKPQFRESGLLMLADSIEAAARSLDEPTPVRLTNIVRNIIQRKFMEGQLDNCNLTLRDLSYIENAFVKILLGIYHQRIDYPKHAGGGAAEAATKIIKAAD